MNNTQLDYEITIEGSMDGGWAEWLSECTLQSEKGMTRLYLAESDRSTFYGLIRKLADLDCHLVSITTRHHDQSPQDKKSAGIVRNGKNLQIPSRKENEQ